jgi:hypothetical protein
MYIFLDGQGYLQMEIHPWKNIIDDIVFFRIRRFIHFIIVWLQSSASRLCRQYGGLSCHSSGTLVQETCLAHSWVGMKTDGIERRTP